MPSDTAILVQSDQVSHNGHSGGCEEEEIALELNSSVMGLKFSGGIPTSLDSPSGRFLVDSKLTYRNSNWSVPISYYFVFSEVVKRYHSNSKFIFWNTLILTQCKQLYMVCSGKFSFILYSLYRICNYSIRFLLY